MRVLTVIGSRPQFVKAAAVSRLLRAEHDELLINTGQHYDDELSAIFVTELGIPELDLDLGLGGGTNTEQTAAMLAAIAPVMAEHRPDVVLVYGDTNSTLAGGLAAAQAGIRVAHVEAGMRSFDRRMPEELNRVLTDHLSDLLLVPTQAAVDNLEREHVAGRIALVARQHLRRYLPDRPLWARRQQLRAQERQHGHHHEAEQEPQDAELLVAPIHIGKRAGGRIEREQRDDAEGREKDEQLAVQDGDVEPLVVAVFDRQHSWRHQERQPENEIDDEDERTCAPQHGRAH